MEWKTGDKASFSKTLSESDIYLFAGVTGDFNPMHVNAVAAADSPFGSRIAHGMLVASFICTVLGQRLPGPGTIHVSQSLNFLAPVRAGDTLTTEVEVISVTVEQGRRRMALRTTVRNQEGVAVVDGEAIVKPPKRTKTG